MIGLSEKWVNIVTLEQYLDLFHCKPFVQLAHDLLFWAGIYHGPAVHFSISNNKPIVSDHMKTLPHLLNYKYSNISLIKQERSRDYYPIS